MYDMFLNYCKTSSALIKPVNLPPQGLAKVFFLKNYICHWLECDYRNNCPSTSDIRVLYHASFNNLYHFQLCWMLEGLDTFSLLIITIAFRLIFTRYIFIFS